MYIQSPLDVWLWTALGGLVLCAVATVLDSLLRQ